jgi:hypothetical protein
VFVLAFVVEVVVGYNPFMHKTQPQKLIFLAFCGVFSGSLNLHLKYKHTLITAANAVLYNCLCRKGEKGSNKKECFI